MSPRAAHAAAPAGAVATPVPQALQSALSPGEIVVLVLKPSPLYIALSSLGTLVSAALLACILAYLSRFAWAPWTEGHALAIGATVAAGRLVAAAIDRQFHFYMLTDRRVLTRRGVLRTVLHETPLSRIQNTIVVQSLRERLFGLGTLGFATAGRGTFDAYWETIARPFVVHRTVLETIERYARRDPSGT